MSKPGKAGRVPLAAKETESSDFSHEDFDYSILKLDPEIKAELDAKGFAYRWVNAPKFKSSGGFHKSGWKPYRIEDDAKRGSLDFAFGVSPEGYLIRNDLILAVKPKEAQEKWRRHLRSKAETQAGTDKTRAEELREMSRRAGVKADVTEGYDDN